jgi:hypothetical protein
MVMEEEMGITAKNALDIYQAYLNKKEMEPQQQIKKNEILEEYTAPKWIAPSGVWVMMGPTEDVAKLRDLAAKAAELYGLIDAGKDEGIILFVSRVLEGIIAPPATPQREPPAKEPPKFGNRPAGSRWR